MAPFQIADWLTGLSFIVISAELIYLRRKRSEFRFCTFLKAFIGLLGILTAAIIADALFDIELTGNVNDLRSILLAVFSVGVAAWLYETVKQIGTLPRLSQLEGMVRERTLSLQSIIDNSPIAFVQVDTEGRVCIWNPAAEKLFGWKAEEVLGEIVPIIPDFKTEEYRKNLDDTLSNRSNPGTMTQRKHKDGRLIDVCYWNAPLKSGKDREVRAMGMFADMSKEVTLTSKLETAKAEAERANEAKSRFLAYMSHEIRNPLSAIIGFADLLGSNNLSPDQRHTYLDTLARNGRCLSRLIDDVLDISKVEAGEMRIDAQACSVREIFDDVRATLELRAVEKGLLFEVSVSDRVPGEMLLDGPRLRQIVMNVAGNAVKFTSRGGVFLHADHAGDELKIVVRDTGPGMTEEQQRRLFLPFDQTHKSVSSKYGGTGLGLVLSKQLAKLMGGHLLLKDSTPGRGSAFEILVSAPVVTKKPAPVKKESLPAQQNI